MTGRAGKLWLALRFEAWPLNALGIGTDVAGAVVVTDKKKRVVSASDVALAAGIHKDMSLTAAHLLVDCTTHPRDVSLEQQTLEALAEQLYRFTPYIETYHSRHTHESGLLLEISRCLKLFHGATSLLEQVLIELQTTHYQVSHGLAHSRQGAWLLSRYIYPVDDNDHAGIFLQRLSQIPVNQLHDHPQAAEALHNMGFEKLGDIEQQIANHSMASLTKRFDAEFIQYLRDLFVIDDDFRQARLFEAPIAVFEPKEHFQQSLDLDYPAHSTEQLLPPITRLLQELGNTLRHRQHSCQHIEWRFYDIERNRESLTVSCGQPQQQSALLLELTRIQLEATTLPFEVDSIELICRDSQPARPATQTLNFSGRQARADEANDFVITLARLHAQLGTQAIFRIQPQDHHLPERSQVQIKPDDPATSDPLQPQPFSLRPSWLLETPIPIQQQREGLYWRGKLELIAGPERHEGHWWDTPVGRDYYLARRDDNVRLWVFFDFRQEVWYVQGVFG